MRFPDLLQKVIDLEVRLLAYRADIDYLFRQVRLVREALNEVRPIQDPSVSRETEGDVDAPLSPSLLPPRPDEA